MRTPSFSHSQGQHRQLVLLARVRAVDTAVLLQEGVRGESEGCSRQLGAVHLAQEDGFQIVLLLRLGTGSFLSGQVEQLGTTAWVVTSRRPDAQNSASASLNASGVHPTGSGGAGGTSRPC